jgi:hypothetical protein
MKQKLLEYLVRQCVREVLAQVREQDDETKGAPSPPAAGLGTADTPAVPKPKDTTPEEPSEPETPPTSLKGAIFVNPRDKSKLSPIGPLPFNISDAALERKLYDISTSYIGPEVKVSLSAFRMVKDAIRNPGSTVYLYFGKFDPESEEIFLMADKSLQAAKDGTVPPAELTRTPVSTASPSQFDPITAEPEQYAQQMTSGGMSPRRGIDERIVKAIKKIVREVLTRK